MAPLACGRVESLARAVGEAVGRGVGANVLAAHATPTRPYKDTCSSRRVPALAVVESLLRSAF